MKMTSLEKVYRSSRQQSHIRVISVSRATSPPVGCYQLDHQMPRHVPSTSSRPGGRTRRGRRERGELCGLSGLSVSYRVPGLTGELTGRRLIICSAATPLSSAQRSGFAYLESAINDRSWELVAELVQ